VATKWGELHTWFDRNNFWDGVVMIYIPETADDGDVAFRLVVDAYNYIPGSISIPPAWSSRATPEGRLIGGGGRAASRCRKATTRR
jgi:hypothetical protein